MDSASLLDGCSVQFSVLKFNEKKLFGKISNFLNDPKKKITAANIDIDENAFDDLPDFISLFKQIQ